MTIFFSFLSHELKNIFFQKGTFIIKIFFIARPQPPRKKVTIRFYLAKKRSHLKDFIEFLIGQCNATYSDHRSEDTDVEAAEFFLSPEEIN